MLKKHVVKPGETLYGIATRTYKITPEELLKSNPQIRNNTIVAGQILNIPLKGLPPAAHENKRETDAQTSEPKPQIPVASPETTFTEPPVQKKESASVLEVPQRVIEAKSKSRSTGVIAGTVIRKPDTISTTPKSIPEVLYKETRVEPKVSVSEIKADKKEVKVVMTDTSKMDALPKKKKKKKRSAAIYDPHVNGIDARNFPSRLGEGFEKAELNLINLHASVSNSSVSYGSIREMLFSEVITDQQAKNIVRSMKNRNQIFVGVDYQSINVAFKIFKKVKKKRVEVLSMELGHRERVTANLQYNKNLFKVLLEGNKQFAGQNVLLGPVRANALYVREFPVGLAIPLNIRTTDHALQFRPALRVKFLMGIGNVYTKKGDASMYTDPEGKYIDFNFNYLVNSSIPNTLRGLSGAGNLGWGTDFGLGINLDQNLSFDIGLIDVGAVRFKNNVRNYSRTGTVHYDGAEANLFTEDDGDKGIGFNINEKLFDPVKTETAYTTPLGAKITLRAEYRFVKSRWGVRRDSTRRYFQHHLYFTYLQGLQNAYSATTTPAFSVGYMYSLKNVLNLGINMGFLGYNKFSVGPFISVKAGAFLIGFGSDNLMPFIAPRAGTGVDAYFNIGLTF